MRLVRYHGEPLDLDTAPGWPHDDTPAALAFADYGGEVWLIVDDDGRIAGECGTKGPPDADGCVEIGYGLAAPSRGRRLGTRAVGALLAELDLAGVAVAVADVDVVNLPSRRLLERLGFALESCDDREARYRRRLCTPRRLG